MKNADLPAMPVNDPMAPPSEFDWVRGLTKREYFAAMVMQGMLTNPANFGGKKELLIKKAVEAADALLEELEK